MVYVSSRDNSKEIKKLYKKYDELPNEIIRQIIHIKVNEKQSIKISEAITKIKKIKIEILEIQKAVNNYELYNRKDDESEFFRRNILVDRGNGYVLAMDIKEVIDRMAYLKSLNQEIMNELRYKQAMEVIDLYANTN